MRPTRFVFFAALSILGPLPLVFVFTSVAGDVTTDLEIIVRVIDAKTKAPVSNAVVTTLVYEEFKGHEPPHNDTTTTDREGRTTYFFPERLCARRVMYGGWYDRLVPNIPYRVLTVTARDYQTKSDIYLELEAYRGTTRRATNGRTIINVTIPLTPDRAH